MGFYAKYVLPRIIDLAMKNKETTRLREAWLPQARGDVLEVGIGSGLNLPFYSPEVQCVYGVDPSVELQRMALKRARAGQIRVEFLLRSAEEPLPIPDASIDTVVVTWTLCSIANAPKSLQQMRRVLKENGRLIFLEHGRAPDPSVVAWQDRITPVWKRIGGGCGRVSDRRVEDVLPSWTAPDDLYVPGPRRAGEVGMNAREREFDLPIRGLRDPT